MSDIKQHTACIIGGGMSGLITGALLAKNGYKVTVIEKNKIIGGGLQSFRRGDAVFNTGMQAFVGYEKGSIVRGILNNYLNISSLSIMPMDENAQEIVWTDKNHCYKLPKGRIAFERYLSEQFPKEKEGISKLVNCIYEIGASYDYIWGKQISIHPEIVKYSYITAEQLEQKYIRDERLKILFGYIGINVGSSLHTMSALDFGMMCTLYIEGSYRFVGGNILLANVLAEYIEQHNGKVINNAEVRDIVCEQGKVKYIVTKNELQIDADVFVSSIAPSNILKMTNADIFRKATQRRVQTYENNFTGYAVYLELKDESFPFINSAIFLPYHSDESFPQYSYILTPPHEGQSKWAKTMEILTPASNSEFSKWENTYIEKRGEDYVRLKESFAEKIINYISGYYPQLKNSIKHIYTATGLTVRDYYNNPRGAVYGQQGLYITVRTKIDNLFMTGQAIQNQGLCGAAVASVLTAETILGRSLIKEIAKT